MIKNKAILLLVYGFVSGLFTAVQAQPGTTLTGVVRSAADGRYLEGVTVKIDGRKEQTATDSEGRFLLRTPQQRGTLSLVHLGYRPYTVRYDGNTTAMDVRLEPASNLLDEAVVIAYGTTTKRLNTGSVGRITADDIAKQPANNVLGVLSGRVPGLEVTQSSGAPGSSFNMQIRGRNSISQGSEPLVLIDGVPFAPQNENLNTLTTSIGQRSQDGGLSPLFSINPSDIESIEVLKDADATAIYGSRGANGVLMITTRRGREGRTSLTANFNQGFTRAPQGMPMLDTEQYLEMRREAFANSGTIPGETNAPDLVLWEQDRYRDLRKKLIGNTGQVSNAQLSLSGGSSALRFLLGGAYYRETNVFPGTLPNQRGGLNVSVGHSSADQKLNVQFSAAYTGTSHRTAGEDLTYYTTIAPNAPDFVDADGKLNWTDGVPNPYSYLLETYLATTGNLTGSLNLSYRILPGLSAKALLGYNTLDGADKRLVPRISTRNEDSSRASFGNRRFRGWSVEPQLEYDGRMLVGRLNVLLGTTLQDNTDTGQSISLGGFPSDALLESQQAASTVIYSSSSRAQYRYQALFGRINYNIADRYLLNLTGRRDGSSRFGPGLRFANFGAVGAAWIFSSEKAVKRSVPAISHGKLRGSYGITGNDQIGNYQYLDAWMAPSGGNAQYDGIPVLRPDNLYNPVYAWEKNRKFELALEMGLARDRVLLEVARFRNRSGNQLVQYRLPYTTGFGFMLMNFPALVENTGWEISLSGDAVKNEHVNWTLSANLTVPKNTLVDFPDIESSTYANSYVIGEPLNLLYNYRSLGVDPETGLYHFLDANEDGAVSARDYLVNGSRDPRYYGGFRNAVGYKGLHLDIFLDFRKQLGRDYRHAMYRPGVERIPGTMNNQPAAVLDRWQEVGDMADLERFAPTPHPNRANVFLSDALYSDQSFIRLRSLHLSYTLPQKVLSAVKAQRASIYVQGQNLYTWNRLKGYDPEVQNIYSLPVPRNYALGVQITY